MLISWKYLCLRFRFFFLVKVKFIKPTKGKHTLNSDIHHITNERPENQIIFLKQIITGNKFIKTKTEVY